MSVLDQVNYDYGLTFRVSSVLLSSVCKKNGWMGVLDQVNYEYGLTFPVLLDVAFLCLLEWLDDFPRSAEL
jgi:hypothetical protein